MKKQATVAAAKVRFISNPSFRSAAFPVSPLRKRLPRPPCT
jgi:hypothetical protein